jgi:hypothetical protein
MIREPLINMLIVYCKAKRITKDLQKLGAKQNHTSKMELKILSKGVEYRCFYDKRDHKLIKQFTWSICNGYAVTNINGKLISMHRLILGIVDNPDLEVDHKFHNGLDNRRKYIRVCTHAQNLQNSRKNKIGSSKFKGVYRDGIFWHSQIMKENRVKNLGRFRSEITAAKVYDQEAREVFKDFAFLNFPAFKEVTQLLIPGL